MILLILLLLAAQMSFAESGWTLIDDQAAFNATTNAHNRKMAEAGPYIFLGYHDANGLCRLVRSRDAGSSWERVKLPDLFVNQAPVLVADSKGRLHVMARMARPEDGSRMRYLRFGEASDWSEPEIDRTSVVAGPKYALAYDSVHDVLYLSHRVQGDLFIAVLDTSGRRLRDELVIKKRSRWREPDYEDAHYQSLCVDAQGWLHVLYTRTQFPLPNYRYRSVRYLRTRDQARTWERADGTPLDTPYEVGDSAPDTQISRPKEEQVSPVWGSSILVINNSVHLLYRVVKDAESVYVRLNRTTGRETSRQELRLDNAANALASSRLTTIEQPPKLFAFGNRDRHPALALSEDQGTTWKIVNTFSDIPIRKGYIVYWNTCMPYLSRTGWFCGAVTERRAAREPRTNKPETGRVFFVRWLQTP